MIGRWLPWLSVANPVTGDLNLFGLSVASLVLLGLCFAPDIGAPRTGHETAQVGAPIANEHSTRTPTPRGAK